MLDKKNISIFKTKLGNFYLQTKKQYIIFLLPTCKMATKSLNPYHKAIHLQIKAYLENKIKNLNFPCLPEGSRFQKIVWYEIKKIGYGKKKSYLEISKKIKSSPRAVGKACSTNPCLFFIPCHRVICNNGSIGEYIMGTRIKKQLLVNEFKL